MRERLPIGARQDGHGCRAFLCAARCKPPWAFRGPTGVFSASPRGFAAMRFNRQSSLFMAKVPSWPQHSSTDAMVTPNFLRIATRSPPPGRGWQGARGRDGTGMLSNFRLARVSLRMDHRNSLGSHGFGNNGPRDPQGPPVPDSRAAASWHKWVDGDDLGAGVHVGHGASFTLACLPLRSPCSQAGMPQH